ncbi:hypothetical protein E4U58_001257 [Claviceps cyperi]|nr:hypothetical protein E4U58_001257 [Claviceps cyperi]
MANIDNLRTTVMCEFPKALDVVKPLCEELWRIIFPPMDLGLNFETPWNNPDELYDPVITVFDKAIRELPKEKLQSDSAIKLEEEQRRNRGGTSAQPHESVAPYARSGQYHSPTVSDESDVEIDIITESEVETDTITPFARSGQYRSPTVSDESVESSNVSHSPRAPANHPGLPPDPVQVAGKLDVSTVLPHGCRPETTAKLRAGPRK